MNYLILILIILSCLGCAEKQEMAAILANNKGVKLLQGDSPSGAQKNFMEALALKPFESTFHNNLGVSLDAAKEIDKAIQSYRFAEDKGDQDMEKFTARFNLAQGLAKQGKIDEALAWYQKALELNPTSQETKTNIELLTKQQKSGGGGQGPNKEKNDQDKQDKDKDKEEKEKDKPRSYQGPEKYKPRPFKGELSESDVKKILGELKQQEQKIRADYNRKDVKEQPRDKDW